MSYTLCRRVAIAAPTVLVLLVFTSSTANARLPYAVRDDQPTAGADKKFVYISRECSGTKLRTIQCPNEDCGKEEGFCARACAADPACGAYETDAAGTCDLLEFCAVATTGEYIDFDAYICTSGCPPGGPDYQMYSNDYYTCSDDGLLETLDIDSDCYDDDNDDTDSMSLYCAFSWCADRCREDPDCNEFGVKDDVTKCALHTKCILGDYDWDNGEYRGVMKYHGNNDAGDSSDSSDSSDDVEDSSDRDSSGNSDSSGTGSGPWKVSDTCVRKYSDTSISPVFRGTSTEKTYTYEKKFHDIDECFENCPKHYIVYGEKSGQCYCWKEDSCEPRGFCADGGCPGNGGGKWESEDDWAVFDQTGCYGRPCSEP